MLLPAIRNLRARLGRTLFTAFAIALGMALVFATSLVGVIIEQSARDARRPPRRRYCRPDCVPDSTGCWCAHRVH